MLLRADRLVAGKRILASDPCVLHVCERGEIGLLAVYGSVSKACRGAVAIWELCIRSERILFLEVRYLIKEAYLTMHSSLPFGLAVWSSRRIARHLHMPRMLDPVNATAHDRSCNVFDMSTMAIAISIRENGREHIMNRPPPPHPDQKVEAPCRTHLIRSFQPHISGASLKSLTTSSRLRGTSSACQHQLPCPAMFSNNQVTVIPSRTDFSCMLFDANITRCLHIVLWSLFYPISSLR